MRQNDGSLNWNMNVNVEKENKVTIKPNKI
jgi:hypothetical protein